MSILETRTLQWLDEAGCAASAGALARHSGLRTAFIELHGPLGAGKTTFVRHLLHALGVQGRIKSPTYAVMEPYELPGKTDPLGGTPNISPLNIWHFDFYRFNDPQEWEDAGFRDVFASVGLKLAEWPEKAGALLPQADLCIHIEPVAVDPDALDASGIPSDLSEPRQVRMIAHTPLGAGLLA